MPLSSELDIPIGPQVVPFYGLYLESDKVIPKKELLRGLWVAISLSFRILTPWHDLKLGARVRLVPGSPRLAQLLRGALLVVRVGSGKGGLYGTTVMVSEIFWEAPKLALNPELEIQISSGLPLVSLVLPVGVVLDWRILHMKWVKLHPKP